MIHLVVIRSLRLHTLSRSCSAQGLRLRSAIPDSQIIVAVEQQGTRSCCFSRISRDIHVDPQQKLCIRSVHSRDAWHIYSRSRKAQSAPVQAPQSQSLSSSSTVARLPCLMPFCFGSYSSTCLLVKRESPTLIAPSPVRSFSTSANRSRQYKSPPTPALSLPRNSPSVFVLSPCSSFSVTICFLTSPSL